MINVDEIVISNTYTRSDFLFRFSLIKRFLEKVEFTSDLNDLSFTEKVHNFLESEEVDSYHSESFSQWGEEFFDVLKSGDFYKNLRDFYERIESDRFFTLTVPVSLEQNIQREISSWIRDRIGQKVLVNIRIDNKLTAGCRFTWCDQQYDFTFRKMRQDRHNHIVESVKDVLSNTVI